MTAQPDRSSSTGERWTFLSGSSHGWTRDARVVVSLPQRASVGQVGPVVGRLRPGSPPHVRQAFAMTMLCEWTLTETWRLN
jgi:hypothetical protein